MLLDFTTRDLSSVRPRLIDDLVIIPQHYGDRTLFHIEVKSKSKFYRVGEAEYTFISLLDGRTTIAGAVTEAARVLGPDALSEQEGFSVCRWLIERGMIDMGEDNMSEPIDLDGSAQLRKLTTLLNPLFIKKKLGNPDRLLQVLHEWFGWVYSPAGIIVWLVVCLSAIGSLIGNAEQFHSAPEGLLAQSNWIWLGLSWAILKVVHEIGHGLAAKRYGGKVPEAGLAFVLLIPMAYVDVTSSYRFPSRWHRIHTAIGGMYVELFIAAVAALIYPHIDSDEVRNQLYNVMFTASFSTILFNANPLMRFDGYFILSDLLNIPNLYTDGQQYTSGIWRRVALGEPRPPLDWHGAKGVAVRVYGVLAAFYRVIVAVSLAIAAAAMFHGAGIVLSVLALAGWLLNPIMQFTKGQMQGNSSLGNRWRGLIVTATVVAAVVSALAFIPWPGDRTAPAIVQFEPLSVLRADSEGFVEEILVANDQEVQAGQVLIRLRNRDLVVERDQLESELARSAAARRMYLEHEELGSAQIEERNQIEQQRQLDELNLQLAALEIRAPHAGRVIARDLKSRFGTFLSAGDPIVEIANDSSKEIHISIPQPDIDAYRAAINETVRVYLPGKRTFNASLTNVDPRALRKPRHESFCVPNGGPISVVVAGSSEEEGTQYEYVRPRFLGSVALPLDVATTLRSGQSGYVSLPTHDVSLGKGIYRVVANWVDQKTREAGFQ